MVNVFKRSLSFPNKPPCRSGPAMSQHIRSISLPCRSHPLISQIKDEIAELRAWSAPAEPASRDSAWLCHGLSRLKELHDSLDDLLQLPQTQESLRRQPRWVEKLLEDFLRFVDVYGMFQTAILALKEEQSAAQVAIRRRDESKAALYVKARRNISKEMDKLVSAIRCIGRVNSAPGSVSVLVGDAVLASVVNEVVHVTKMVSTALFNGISGSQKCLWTGLRSKKMKVDEEIQEFKEVVSESLWGLRKKGVEEVRLISKKMRDLESVIVAIECGSDRVFRGLISARVSLLNSLTQ